MILVVVLYLLIGVGVAISATASVWKPSDGFLVPCAAAATVALVWPGFLLWYWARN